MSEPMSDNELLALLADGARLLSLQELARARPEVSRLLRHRPHTYPRPGDSRRLPDEPTGIRFTDKTPYSVGHTWRWWNGDVNDIHPESENPPGSIFDLLPGGWLYSNHSRYYDTEQEAHDALSIGGWTWAKNEPCVKTPDLLK